MLVENPRRIFEVQGAYADAAAVWCVRGARTPACCVATLGDARRYIKRRLDTHAQVECAPRPL